MTGLDAVADELYGGDPSGFVSLRDARAREARASGDRELATAIKALRRPSVSAWYVNAAARASLVSLREWLTLGRDLRAASEGLDAVRLRELGGRRSRLESRVVADIAAHVGALGAVASPVALDEVRSTLRAALSDERAALAVAAGRLDRALSYGGFGEVDLSAALAAMAARAAVTVAEPVEAEPVAEPVEAEPVAEPVEAEAEADAVDPKAEARARAEQEAVERAREEARQAVESARDAVARDEAAWAAARRAEAAASEALAASRARLAEAESRLEQFNAMPAAG